MSGGVYGVLGFRQLNTCRKVPLQVILFRVRHFALSSIKKFALKKPGRLLVLVLALDLVALLILSRLGSAPDSAPIIGLSRLGPVSVWAHAPVWEARVPRAA